jgi:hypothetical protein
MAGNNGRKAIVAACMESPFYFTLPLRERLALMRQLDQITPFSTLRHDFLSWIKTGRLSPPGNIAPWPQPDPET